MNDLLIYYFSIATLTIRTIINMSSLMLESIWRIIELFLTKAALKRFFSSVSPHMNFQIFMPRKSLTTFTTNMRFFLKIDLLKISLFKLSSIFKTLQSENLFLLPFTEYCGTLVWIRIWICILYLALNSRSLLGQSFHLQTNPPPVAEGLKYEFWFTKNCAFGASRLT